MFRFLLRGTWHNLYAMTDEQNSEPPRYRWPKFLLAGVILGIVLAIIWVSFAARNVKQTRDPFAPLPTNSSGR
jgi:hypothetical protein